MLAPTPSLALAAFEANDDGRLKAELRLVRVRAQAALVRALADGVEHLSLERLFSVHEGPFDEPPTRTTAPSSLPAKCAWSLDTYEAS
jgi:hypothetical protein